eukprot:Gregarina_sp_Poly_1__2514@NODE_1680_length_3547_cov_454_777874_g825_i1_p1_GENE_NODE_1680_length_3547_cov_454_777874_g825_i1NODE_1680_length_3547_cov_454_777874_g825_i1_p1_ORF_typecomplete_len486_score60_61GDI/PF00996_18/3_8e118Amino_oxidase/PF01593_24/8_6e06_NODE_1680_length_3547_cov_454_777874_g825_i120883428
MNEEYDVVVCGTGLKECILSGLLSTHGTLIQLRFVTVFAPGKKVLHVDRNPYYGGESASLNLTNLFHHFENGAAPPESWGANREWNVDLIPKFIMANGKLTKILIKSQVKDYLEFKVVEGTYVYQHQKAGWLTNEKFIHKVPSSDKEALTSSLIPYSEKVRGRSFFIFIANWNRSDPKTWGKFNPDKTPMSEVYQSFGLQENTIDFVGHAIALYTTDEYMHQPMGVTMDRLRLYMNSLVRYGTSPFIYPMYGLGTLPEGFSRLSAVYGGTYMLSTPIEKFLYGKDGKVIGVQTERGEVAHCKMVVCDPSYVKDTPKVALIGKVIRCINVLNAPIPSTGGRDSCQIILPQKQLGRHSDIYIAEISADHGVAKQGKYIALVSTTIETENPLEEIKPALNLLGDIEKQFVNITNMYVATDEGKADNVFVTDSYDATSHFESATENCLTM